MSNGIGGGCFSLEQAKAAFDSKIRKSENGCWIWIGACNNKGYGVLTFQAHRAQAHRLSWTLNVGEIPQNTCVLHRCDNPPCVNPEHLFLGTFSDNMKDCYSKGRHRRMVQNGASNPMSRLTDSQVEFIRQAIKEGFKTTVVARYFDVSYTTISMIANGHTWKHL